MSNTQHVPDDGPSAAAASADNELSGSAAAVHADYRALVRGLTELTQEEFDQKADWAQPPVRVVVRVSG